MSRARLRPALRMAIRGGARGDTTPPLPPPQDAHAPGEQWLNAAQADDSEGPGLLDAQSRLRQAVVIRRAR